MKSFCLGVMSGNDLHHEGASIAALTRCPGYFEIAVRPENDLLRPGPMRLLGLCEGFCALDAEMIAFVADGIVGLYFGDGCPVVELRRRTQTYSPARWLETNYFPLLPACQQNSHPATPTPHLAAGVLPSQNRQINRECIARVESHLLRLLICGPRGTIESLRDVAVGVN